MPIELYIIINNDKSSSAYKDIIAIYRTLGEAEKNIDEISENEKVLMLIMETED